MLDGEKGQMVGAASNSRIVIVLPRLGGTRADADQLLADANLPEQAPPGAQIVLVGSEVLAASTSFSDQLVKRLLEERNDLSLVMVAPTKRMRSQVSSSRNRRGIGKNRLSFSSAATALA